MIRKVNNFGQTRVAQWDAGNDAFNNKPYLSTLYIAPSLQLYGKILRSFTS